MRESRPSLHLLAFPAQGFLLYLHNSSLWNLRPLVWKLEVSENGYNQGRVEIGKIVERCLESGRGRLSKQTQIIGVQIRELRLGEHEDGTGSSSLAHHSVGAALGAVSGEGHSRCPRLCRKKVLLGVPHLLRQGRGRKASACPNPR